MNTTFLRLFSIIILVMNGKNSMALEENCERKAALENILKICNVSHEGTLDSMVQATQREWIGKLRPGDCERWEMNEGEKESLEKKRNALMPWLHQTGVIAPLVPVQQYYTYAVLLGSTVRSFCSRLAYLLSLTQQGVTFDSVVALTGERSLLENETYTAFVDFCKQFNIPLKESHTYAEFPYDEGEMVRYIMNAVDLPSSWKDKVTIVYALAQYDAAGKKMRRATTVDTVKAWCAQDPKPGTILVISEQPYCLYQGEALKTYMPQEFDIETVGNEPKKETSIALYLDSIARYLYQLQQRQHLYNQVKTA